MERGLHELDVRNFGILGQVNVEVPVSTQAGMIELQVKVGDGESPPVPVKIIR